MPAKIPTVQMKSYKTKAAVERNIAKFKAACDRYHPKSRSRLSSPRASPPGSPRGRIPKGGVPLPFHASMLAGVKLRATDGPEQKKKVPVGGKSLGISLDDIHSRLSAMKSGSRKTYVSRPAVMTEAEKRRLQTIQEIQEKNRARAARTGMVDGKGRRSRKRKSRRSRRSKSGSKRKSRKSKSRSKRKSRKSKSRSKSKSRRSGSKRKSVRRKLSKLSAARRSVRRAQTLRAKKRVSSRKMVYAL